MTLKELKESTGMTQAETAKKSRNLYFAKGNENYDLPIKRRAIQNKNVRVDWHCFWSGSVPNWNCFSAFRKTDSRNRRSDIVHSLVCRRRILC